MESSLNYTLGNIGKAYNMSTVDSITVPLTLGATSTSNVVVYAAFENLVALLAPLNTEEQHIAVVDVIEPNQGAQEVIVRYELASGYQKGAPNSTYSTNNDHTWGKLGDVQPHSTCRCGANTVTPEFCANRIIQQRINAANFYSLSPVQYVTNVETWTVGWEPTDLSVKLYNFRAAPMQGPSPVGDGYRDSKTFSWRSNSTLPLGGGLCVQNTEMTYWTGNATQGTWSAITTIRGLHCPSKLFLSCNLASYQVGFPGPPDWFMHYCQFTYGQIVSQGTPG